MLYFYLYIYIYIYYMMYNSLIYIYIYIIMLCSIIYIILIRIKEERGVISGHHFNWWKHQILTTHVMHILLENGAMQNNLLKQFKKYKKKKKTPYPLSSLTFPPPSLQNLYDLLWTELKKGLCAAIFKVK